MGYVFDLGSVLSGKYLDWFLIGIATTLALTAAAWCLAMTMGIILTLVRMIPFPPLDGGRMLMITLKSLFGSRISLRAEQLTYMVGFVFLFAFIIWITGNDIIRGLGGT